MRKSLNLVVLTCVLITHCHSKHSTFPATYMMNDAFEKAIINEAVEQIETNKDAEYQMLDLLGLSERPKRIKKTASMSKSASKFLLDVYKSLNEDSALDAKRTRKRRVRSVHGDNFITPQDRMEIEKCNNIITFSSRPLKEVAHTDTAIDWHMSFNLNEIPSDYKLSRAELRLYQDGSDGHSERKYTISILQRNKHAKEEYKIISTINTTSSYEGWLELDVTSALSKWLLKGKRSQGLSVVINPMEGTGLGKASDFGLVDVYGEEQFQPFMIGYFNGPDIITKFKHIRHKRHASMAAGESNKRKRKVDPYRRPPPENVEIPKTCQRMDFSMDFKDLQMEDWVIAPKKFEAYFCSGECNFPLGSKMNATNHAIVQTLMHLKQPNLPKPCCTPTSLGSIAILHHLNEDSVNLSNYPAIVAKSCGCH